MANLTIEDAILALILDGAESPNEIASILRVDVDEVKRALKNLELEGLVKVEEKGFWIFKRKVYKLTTKGYEKAVEAKKRISKIAEEIKNTLEKVKKGLIGKDTVISELEPYIQFFPLFLYFNLLDLMLLLPLIELPLIASILEDYGDYEGLGGDVDSFEDVDIS